MLHETTEAATSTSTATSTGCAAPNSAPCKPDTRVRRMSFSQKRLQDGLTESPPKQSARKFSWAGVKQRMMSAAIGGSNADVDNWNLDELPANFFDLSAIDAKGSSLPLTTFQGHVCLVLNVASF